LNETPALIGLQREKRTGEMGMATRRMTIGERTARRARERYEENAPQREAERLARTCPFDLKGKFNAPGEYRAMIDRLIEHIFDRIDINKRSKILQKKQCLRVVLSNVLRAFLDQRVVAISLNKNHYPRDRRYPGVTASILLPIIRELVDKGWIDRKEGYSYPGKDGQRVTRIWPADRLVTLSRIHQLATGACEVLPESLVIMRNRRGKEIPFKATRRTTALTNSLTKINDVNCHSAITYYDPVNRCRKRINPSLYAVFNHSSWRKGGRLYTGGQGSVTGPCLKLHIARGCDLKNWSD
jgi:hypothetical protein